MSSGSRVVLADVDNKPTGDVAESIARRYAHPGRTAYTYLFRLKPGGDFGSLVPVTGDILTAWTDEGSGLAPEDPQSAVQRCKAVVEARLKIMRPRTSQERRRKMARSILFTVTQPGEDLIEVHLLSRALAFSPKGDREVVEQWRRSEEGWFSSYVPTSDELGPT